MNWLVLGVELRQLTFISCCFCFLKAKYKVSTLNYSENPPNERVFPGSLYVVVKLRFFHLGGS